MRGWIRFSALTGACALAWACSGGGGAIFSNPNANVVSTTSTMAVVGRGGVDATANQVPSSALPERNDVSVVDSESTTDTDDRAAGTMAAAAGSPGLPTPSASKPGWIKAPQPEGSRSGNPNGVITVIINIGGDEDLHVLGDDHSHPLIAIVDDTNTSTASDVIVRQGSPISVKAESAATNRVRGSLSS